MKHQINRFKYKETNIDWIGNIPSHWDYKKMKYLASIITGNTPPRSDEDNYRDGTYPWVKPDNLNKDYTISNTKEKLSEKGIELARIVPVNSALVCSIGTVGKVAINKEPVATNQQINSIIFDRENWLNQYGTYAVIAAESEFKKYSNKVVVSILNKTSQENIFMPLPKIYEQKIIGTFLDQKISEIDALIADKEKLITLLEEKRQATITEAVTKGLDSNVKMKSSGVEWIGEIPEHWAVMKIKYAMSIMNGREITREVNDVEDIKKYKVYGSGGFFKWTDDYLYNGKSVLFGRKGTIGKPLYIDEPFWTVDTMYYSIVKKNRADTRYLYFVLSIFPWKIITTQTALPSIVSTDLGNEKWCFPDIKEQKSITNYLNSINEEINDNVKLIEKQIRLLKEYRQSLIYEAVTGKIDVQEMEKEITQEEVSYS